VDPATPLRFAQEDSWRVSLREVAGPTHIVVTLRAVAGPTPAGTLAQGWILRLRAG